MINKTFETTEDFIQAFETMAMEFLLAHGKVRHIFEKWSPFYMLCGWYSLDIDGHMNLRVRKMQKPSNNPDPTYSERISEVQGITTNTCLILWQEMVEAIQRTLPG